MSCFGFLEKFILEKCYPPGGPAGLQIPQPMPESPKFDTKAKAEIEKPITPVVRRKMKSEDEEHEDLFKEMEPKYVAAKRVNVVLLANDEKAKTKTRFDIEENDTGNWGEDFKLD